LGGIVIMTLWLLDRAVSRDTAQARLDEAEFASLVESGHRLGEPNAPVVLLVYNDYRCGFCAALHRALRVLRRRYPQHLAVVYKHFVGTSAASGRHYLVPHGAECAAEQDVFEAYHASAFAKARILDYADAPQLLAENAAVLDSTAFRECMNSRRHVDTVRRHYQEATRLGVDATPTMFLNGIRMIGAFPLVVLDSLIVRELPR
jgi:protein-disulfide isomerase